MEKRLKSEATCANYAADAEQRGGSNLVTEAGSCYCFDCCSSASERWEPLRQQHEREREHEASAGVRAEKRFPGAAAAAANASTRAQPTSLRLLIDGGAVLLHTVAAIRGVGRRQGVGSR